MATTKKKQASTQLTDGLKNVVANLGTGRDKLASTEYFNQFYSAEQLLTMYRNSWLARSIVDLMAEDATRKWRKWRAPADQISKLERLEKKLKVKSRVKASKVAARLYGGACVYLNTESQTQDTELRPGSEEIKSLVVLTTNNLTAEQRVTDINSRYFGLPEHYFLTTGGNADRVRIHASRLVIFTGADLPDDAGGMALINKWGDSVLQSCMDAIRQADSTMANIASLVFEAKVDVMKFKGFAEMLANEANDSLIIRRLTNQAAMKGINGALVIDSEDDYEQKNASFGGLPEIVSKFMDCVSGASRYPVTRLFGRSAVGLSGSGDGDERVYFDRVSDEQSDMSEAMEIMDECLIIQALGSRPDDVYFEWSPLRQLTETERADIFSKTATAARALAGGVEPIIPIDALSDSVVNEFVEQGMLPGLETAIAKYGSMSEQGLPIDNEADPVRKIADSLPQPLYVSRKVKNAQEILAHYKAQGVMNMVDAADMHVTITYSREPVQWMKMGESWSPELVVNAGGPRETDVFGSEKNTLVLAFASSELTYRHSRMVEEGASYDFPEYQPHVSISYAFDGDASKITPWQGQIKFGPEIFESIDEEWGS